MKLLSTMGFKQVMYFGLNLTVPESTQWLVTTPSGDVIASVGEPELDPKLGWLYDWDDRNQWVASVDLERMCWKDTSLQIN